MQKNILKEETLTHKLISKWFRAYVFVIFTAPLWYLVRLVASNTLSVADIWIIYWVISLFGLLACYNDLGLTESMCYFLPKYRLEGKKWQIQPISIDLPFSLLHHKDYHNAHESIVSLVYRQTG